AAPGRGGETPQHYVSSARTPPAPIQIFTARNASRRSGGVVKTTYAAATPATLRMTFAVMRAFSFVMAGSAPARTTRRGRRRGRAVGDVPGRVAHLARRIADVAVRFLGAAIHRVLRLVIGFAPALGRLLVDVATALGRLAIHVATLVRPL